MNSYTPLQNISCPVTTILKQTMYNYAVTRHVLFRNIGKRLDGQETLVGVSKIKQIEMNSVRVRIRRWFYREDLTCDNICFQSIACQNNLQSDRLDEIYGMRPVQ